MRLASGCTRRVLLIGSLAIKWPKVTGGFKANRYERRRWQTGDVRLCPILFSDPFGLLVIMRRAADLEPVEAWEIIAQTDFSGLPHDTIPENVGLIDGRLVMVDYGALGHPPNEHNHFLHPRNP